MKRFVVGLVAVAMLGGCGSRVRNWPDEMAVVDVTTTDRVTPRPTSTVREGDEPRPTTTRKQASGPTTSVRSSLPRPAPGRYTYDVEFHVPAFEDEPATDEKDTYDVTWAVSGSDSELTLVESDDSDTESTYRVTASGLELRSVNYTDEEDSYLCTWAPAQLLLKLPLTPGAKWTTDSTCKFEDGEVDRQTLRAEVTGAATDTIGGVKVDTFIVQWTETLTERYPDDEEVYEYKSVRIAHVDPKTLLIVSEEIRDQSEDGLGATSKRKLKSLNPR